MCSASFRLQVLALLMQISVITMSPDRNGAKEEAVIWLDVIILRGVGLIRGFVLLYLFHLINFIALFSPHFHTCCYFLLE